VVHRLHVRIRLHRVGLLHVTLFIGCRERHIVRLLRCRAPTAVDPITSTTRMSAINVVFSRM
jgi:hypothetical protein